MTYKDSFTLDGRLHPQAGVTKRKVKWMTEALSGVLRGDIRKTAELVEAMSTTDAVFNFAHAFNLTFIPQWEEAPRTWRRIAGTRGASDFRPVNLYTLTRKWDEGTLGDGDPAFVSPVVPEGTPYPLAYMAGEQIEGGSLLKRGFKTDFTFEALKNDPVGFITALPSEMREVALDTEEYEVYSALLANLTADNALAKGKVPDGTEVAADSPLSREALILAKIQLATRKVAGRQIGTRLGKLILLVAPGQKIYADFILNNVALSRIDSDPLRLSVSGYNPLADIEAVESEYLEGSQWALVPEGGKIGNRPTLDRLNLIGYEAPELRVSNATGSYVGGGAVSPFEGSFDNDSTTFRLRQFGGAVAWTPQAFIWSPGA